MQNLTQTIRNAISGMFTKNIVDEVVRRIIQEVERERSDCGDKEGARTVS